LPEAASYRVPHGVEQPARRRLRARAGRGAHRALWPGTGCPRRGSPLRSRTPTPPGQAGAGHRGHPGPLGEASGTALTVAASPAGPAPTTARSKTSEEAAAGEEHVSELTRQQVKLAVTAAARKDDGFGQAVTELVAQLRSGSSSLAGNTGSHRTGNHPPNTGPAASKTGAWPSTEPGGASTMTFPGATTRTRPDLCRIRHPPGRADRLPRLNAAAPYLGAGAKHPHQGL
jgi:hypothetical protein